MDSLHEDEIASAKQDVSTVRRPPRRARLASGIRRTSKGLMSSFTKSLTGRIDENGSDVDAIFEDAIVKSTPSSASAAQVAQLVASEFFAQESDPEAYSSAAKKSHQLHNSVAGSVSAVQAARLAAAEYFGEEDDLELHSQMVGKEKYSGGINGKESATADTVESESCHSTPSSEVSIALEVGISAHEYLEECFYTEVSVLDREKFHAIPEIIKADFTITRHLGKGSFSDVFEVVQKLGPLNKKSNVTVNSRRHSEDIATASDDTKVNRRRPSRRTSLSNSISTATFASPSCGDSKLVFAMKCLRPQIRSDIDRFTVGAEDLVHETAILASLNHPNIIKLHGRASGNLADAFVLNDGYFIILDKLNETLQERIDAWKSKFIFQGLTAKQIEVAQSIARAVSYLHSKNIVFRDLKPANVGFDSMGVLKLFDFGFATGLPEKDETNPAGFLYDKAGTPRYMAPEVALCGGYDLKADVYSFGVLLWEICALTKPFLSVTSASEFERDVFTGRKRPKIKNHWPTTLKEIISNCWSADPSERPDQLMDVESSLKSVMSNITRGKKSTVNNVRSLLTQKNPSAAWY